MDILDEVQEALREGDEEAINEHYFRVWKAGKRTAPYVVSPYKDVSSCNDLVEAQKREEAWFRENLSDLLRKKRFRGKYVAIRDQDIIYAERDLGRLFNHLQSGPYRDKRVYIERVEQVLQEDCLIWGGC